MNDPQVSEIVVPETAVGKALAEVITLAREVCPDQRFLEHCVIAFLRRPAPSEATPRRVKADAGLTASLCADLKRGRVVTRDAADTDPDHILQKIDSYLPVLRKHGLDTCGLLEFTMCSSRPGGGRIRVFASFGPSTIFEGGVAVSASRSDLRAVDGDFVSISHAWRSDKDLPDRPLTPEILNAVLESMGYYGED